MCPSLKPSTTIIESSTTQKMSNTSCRSIDFSNFEPMPLHSDDKVKMQFEGVLNVIEAVDDILEKESGADVGPAPIGPDGLQSVVKQVDLNENSWHGDAAVVWNLHELFGKRKIDETAFCAPGKKSKVCCSEIPAVVMDDQKDDVPPLHITSTLDEVTSTPFKELDINIYDPKASTTEPTADDFLQLLTIIEKEETTSDSSSTGSSRREQHAVEGFSYSSTPYDERTSNMLQCSHSWQSNRWEERFQELLKFRQTYGHCHVPDKWKHNLNLAYWVKRQRYQYKLKLDKPGKRTTMTDARRAALERIGFVWDSHSAAWEERFNDLRAYKKIHGHCNVRSTCPIYPGLAHWVKAQRREYRNIVKGKKSESDIFRQRVKKLNSLDFEWNPRNMKLN